MRVSEDCPPGKPKPGRSVKKPWPLPTDNAVTEYARGSAGSAPTGRLKLDPTIGALPMKAAKTPPWMRLTPAPKRSVCLPNVLVPSYFVCLLLWKVFCGARKFGPEQKG